MAEYLDVRADLDPTRGGYTRLSADPPLPF